jgi:hypothetical protein
VSILLGGGCGTPKGGRRRNKRKGCDSPRSSAEDKNTTTAVVKPEATTPDILPVGEHIIDPFPEKCSGMLTKLQLLFPSVLGCRKCLFASAKRNKYFRVLTTSLCKQTIFACLPAGQGQFRQQLCFDLMQLQDKEEDEAEAEEVNCEDGDRQGNEPVTSHGMRPARGWASLNILPV